MDWWLSTKTSPKAFRPKGLTPDREAHLRAHPLVDAAILADDLGTHLSHVLSFQRWLGIRSCVPNYVPKAERVLCR